MEDGREGTHRRDEAVRRLDDVGARVVEHEAAGTCVGRRRRASVSDSSSERERERGRDAPYVFLASPLVRHLLPTSAACWSPIKPAIGMPSRTWPFLNTPYTSELDTMRGRHHFGTSKKSHSSSHQSCLCRLNRSVRHALVPSVMCLPPSLPPVYCCARRARREGLERQVRLARSGAQSQEGEGGEDARRRATCRRCRT